MTSWSSDEHTASYGPMQHQPQSGAMLLIQSTSGFGRKGQKMSLSGSKEKEKPFSRICKPCLPIRVGMLLLALASAAVLVMILTGFKRSITLSEIPKASEFSPFPQGSRPLVSGVPTASSFISQNDKRSMEERPPPKGNLDVPKNRSQYHIPVAFETPLPLKHPCEGFSFSPPPADKKRTGPRPCPVCYVPVEHAIALMPATSSISPTLKNLMYVSEEDPSTDESSSGFKFGGHPSMKQRNEAFDVKESMSVHCGFVYGDRPGNGTGFDIEVADLLEMEQCHGVVVASSIFGNYDIMQQPKNISEAAKRSVCFYMFVDEETAACIKNSTTPGSTNRVGLWSVVIIRNLPYSDPRRNGKVPKFLLHRIFPNARFSLWIDGKLELVVDPYQVLERFLWRKNATFAISRHYKRFDVFEEAEANKAAGKYDNASIDRQIDFYKSEGLTHYSSAKLPITSDVPEACVIIREHTPISNLFTCLWFNEVDRFTSRDQLSFSTVRDKIRSKVNWTIEMFMDCERRNFVVQGYHRDVLEQKRALVASSGRPLAQLAPPSPPKELLPESVPILKVKKAPIRRGREMKSSSKR
ncbi:unnamed protein product [Spirodela intermedia]|uniref:TOD1/MUCI70 glycosyltransferase-like domain-containing protein n=1 Tax=Spirodela intermedia TaxID=51605 RepID=A0A7I8KXB7_SPIIN|nr:unnamed protein product [Spirodela intermedia]